MAQKIAKPILFDTTVFIDYMRGSPVAKIWVEKVLHGEIRAYVCPLTDCELWIGARNEQEIKTQKALISKFRRANLHATITRRAGSLGNPFYLKSDKSISTADFIIAATAEYIGADVLTRNTRDFPRIPAKGVQVITYNFK